MLTQFALPNQAPFPLQHSLALRMHTGAMSAIPAAASNSWKSVFLAEAARALESSELEKVDKQGLVALSAPLSAPLSAYIPVPRETPSSSKMSIEFLLAPEVNQSGSQGSQDQRTSLNLRHHSTSQESRQSSNSPASPLSTSSPATPSRDRPHACPECHKLFLKKHHLHSHLETHYNRKRYGCNVLGCRSAFTRVHDLQRHQKSVHQKQASQGAGVEELNL